MRIDSALRVLLASFALVASMLITTAPAAAVEPSLNGTVTDSVSNAPIEDICVTIGPPVRCVTYTNAQGQWSVSLSGAPLGLAWDLGFFKHGGEQAGQFRSSCQVDPNGPSCFYSTSVSIPGVVANGPTTVNAKMVRDQGAPPPVVVGCPDARADTPTMTNYLPNITKTLGGPTGFQTPFIVQNTGAALTTMEISFYKFSDGTCVKRFNVDRAPGTSFAFVPNNDTSLPGDSQFAVVVRSYGATIVSVVNEHQGVGDRAEALSYTGASSGSKNVYLPNITRRFFGFVTPFIIQNLGATTTTVQAQFIVRFGQAAPTNVTRVIEPGRSQFVDPNSTPGLVDGTAYAVTITADQPVAVVVNTHKDAPTEAHPVAYSTNGITTGANKIFGAYAAKNADGIGRLSTIVVQNVGTTQVTPTITFTPLGGGQTRQFSFVPMDPNRSAAFDPRYQNGDSTTGVLCSPDGGQSCLADGEYTFEVTAQGTIAGVVNVISDATAMGYSTSSRPAARYFLPNVTRTLGGDAGWTTPIFLQSATATSATLRWFRFSDGSIVTTQNVTLAPSTGIRIDPRSVAGLSDDTQYSVIVDANSGGTLNAIVEELAQGGDNAMIYEGFPAPATGTTTTDQQPQ